MGPPGARGQDLGRRTPAYAACWIKDRRLPAGSRRVATCPTPSTQTGAICTLTPSSWARFTVSSTSLTRAQHCSGLSFLYPHGMVLAAAVWGDHLPSPSRGSNPHAPSHFFVSSEVLGPLFLGSLALRSLRAYALFRGATAHQGHQHPAPGAFGWAPADVRSELPRVRSPPDSSGRLDLLLG